MSEIDFISRGFEEFVTHFSFLRKVLCFPLFGRALWRYLGYLIWIFLGHFVVLRILGYFKELALDALERQKKEIGAKLLRELAWPIKIALTLALLFGGLRLFHLAGATLRLQEPLLILSYGFCITLFLLRLAEGVLLRCRFVSGAEEKLNKQLFLLAEKGVKFLIISSCGMTTLHTLGINISSLLASLSIGSLAVALAAQDTLANLFGAVSILVDHTFKLGDTIELEGHKGSVEAIGLRSTRIRNSEGHLVTIPNKNIGTAIITNITERKQYKTIFHFSMHYENSSAELARACTLLQSILKENPYTESVAVYFSRFTETALLLEATHLCKPCSEKIYRETIHDFNLQIKESFDREEMRFVSPSSPLLKGRERSL